MKKLKVAVIGVGRLGKEHARIYSGFPEVELLGVVDTDINRAKEVAETYNSKSFSHVSAIENLVDAASIVVPTDKHFEVASRLIQKGKCLLIEKPIASNLKDARVLVRLAEKKNVFLQVGHVERFNPIIEFLSRNVTNPKFIEIHRLSPFTPRGTEVGVVLDLMIHDIDIILALVKDDIKKIDAVGVSALTPHEDIANARITFKNGCVANLTASRVSPDRMRKIRIFQPNSYTSVDYYKQEGVSFFKKGNEIVKDTLSVGKDEPLKLELRDFVNCVLNKKRPKVSGEDATKALSVAQKIQGKIWK